jgi:NAD(P)-dependent dehydrogenase (short-subunit alcohol dehydrogenase family)
MVNKKVLVVGGSKGIGAGVVDEFVNRGADVTYFSRTKGSNPSARHMSIDLEDVSEIYSGFSILNSIFRSNRKIDILVNCAGINFCKTHDNISDREWDTVMNVNLKSFFITCKESIKMMPDGGKIVNVASIAGRNRSVVSGVHYTASKAGIIGLTKQLAYEVGEKGINVNCVCPSQTVTEMLEESMTKEEQKKLSEGIPLRRLATVEDIVKPILFLCSEYSNYIHGACIDINGGQL